MWYTGAWFEMSRYRFIASWTTRGLGQTPPLFKLMRVRSSVNDSWIWRQKSSSIATSSAERPATISDARATRASRSGRPIATSAAVPVARCRNARRLEIDMRGILALPRRERS